MKTRRDCSFDSLSFECSNFPLSIPAELWRLIFTFDYENRLSQFQTAIKNGEDFSQQLSKMKEAEFQSLESTLKLVGSICKYWSQIVRVTAQDYFNSNDRISNWMLKQSDRLRVKSLLLHRENSITDEVLSKFDNLTHLDIGYNQRISDECLSKLTNLTQLKLGNFQLISDHSLSCLNKLKALKINNNRNISDFGLKLMTNLTKLTIGPNRVTDDSLSELTNLVELELYNPLFVFLPEHPFYHVQIISDQSVMKLTQLTKLSLRQNTLITDQAILKLTNLTDLSISGIGPITFDGIKQILKNMKNLKSFHLIDHLRSLSPEEWEKLSHFEVMRR